MSTVLLCLAGALLLIPVSGRRRSALLSRSAAHERHIPMRVVVVGVVIVVGVAAAVVNPFVALAWSVLSGVALLRLRRWRRDRHRRVEVAALLETLTSVVGELRIGANPSVAAQHAADEGDSIATEAFAIAAARGRLGGQTAAGLRRPDSVIAAELERIARVWSVAERYGLALAELLATARQDLADRVSFRRRTEAALAGARATAAILAGLPLVGIGLGQSMGAAPVAVLVTTRMGGLLLVVGVGLAGLGVLWSDSISRKALL